MKTIFKKTISYKSPKKVGISKLPARKLKKMKLSKEKRVGSPKIRSYARMTNRFGNKL